MAISSDKHLSTEPDEPRASPVSSRILPGYIPGMPRPMTPRENMDSDDQRSYSTTPRATSPTLPSPSQTSIISSVGLLRRDSTSSPSRLSPRPVSPGAPPMFLQRTPNGRHTPDDSRDTFSGDFDAPLNSSILGRRRPASPLSGTAYQPLAVSSRPGTPSNVTWTTPISNGTAKSSLEHSRNGSWVSDFGTGPDMSGSIDNLKSPTRSLRSPALPDSPLISGHTNMNSIGSNLSTTSSFEPRPASSISGADIGSPVVSSSRLPRSPTPTQNLQRSPPVSPLAPNFDTSSRNGSRRSSKQHAPSPPFSLGPYPPLFSPIANSSRSSLESAGSSYHSWDTDAKDRSAALLTDVDAQQPVWHDIPVPEQATSVAGDEWEAEDIIERYAGLQKADFHAIQEKLVGFAIAKTSAPDVRDRAPSLRRRRPSTSQSNYSLNGRVRYIFTRASLHFLTRPI